MGGVKRKLLADCVNQYKVLSTLKLRLWLSENTEQQVQRVTVSDKLCLGEAMQSGSNFTKHKCKVENVCYSHFPPAQDEPSCGPLKYPSALHLPHREKERGRKKNVQVNVRRKTGQQ